MLFVIVALFADPALAAGSAAPSVGVAGSLETVRPYSDFEGPPGASISAARNELESFQVVVNGGDDARLYNLYVRLAQPLSGPGGTIPAKNVSIFRESYIDLKRQSDLEGGAGRWPDALIPAVDPYWGEKRDAFPVEVPIGENRVAWVDVFVPPDQPAGTYTGELIVHASGGLAQTVPIQLEVRDFGLPSTTSLESSFGIKWDVCTSHYGGSCNSDGETGWALKSLYVRAALENRVTVSNPEFQPPVPEHREFFRSYVQPLFDGETPGDEYGEYNEYSELQPMLLEGARLTSVEVDNGPHVGDWMREAERGDFTSQAFLYACDEPARDKDRWRECKRSARRAGATWPDLDVLITASIRDAVRFGGNGLIDIIVPIVNNLHDKPGSPYAGNQRSTYDDFLFEADNRLWMYNACPSHGCKGDRGDDPYWAGWPSYVIDQPASEHRAMGILAYEYGATGELYFNTTYDLDTAWSDQRSFGGNGDGTLFYPGRPKRIGGTQHIPIESIRLKRIRDGHEDYEYLHLLDQADAGDEAMSIARDLFPTMYETDVPAGDFEATRDELADLIESG